MTTASAPFDLTLLPGVGAGRRRRPGRGRRRRPASGWPSASARRSTSTTKPSSAPGAASTRRAFGDGVAYASKAFLCAAMARLVAEEGLAPRRRDRRRAARRAARRLPGRAHRVPRQQQVDRRAAAPRSTPASAASSSTRSTSSIASTRWSRDGRRDARACTCASRPASRRTRTSTSRPAPRTRSSASGSTTATRSRAVAAHRRATATLRFAGMHCHIGSQVFRLDSFARAVEKMVGLVRAIETETGATVDELNLGGGLGVRYLADDDAAVDRASTRGACTTRVAKALADAGVRSRPAADDRARAARSRRRPGLTLYTVGTIKDDPRRPHLRRGRRRHERQPPPGHLRRALRGVPPGARHRAAPARRDGRRQALRAGRPARARRAAARRRRGRRHPRDAGHRCATATRWRPTTTRCCARPSCSSATGPPASSSAARPTPTSSASTPTADPPAFSPFPKSR